MRLALLATITLAASTSFAQVSPNEKTPGQTNAPPATTPAAPHDITGSTTALPGPGGSQVDQKFVRDAAQANLAEIKLSQLAMRNGTSADVRRMGERMLGYHRELGDKLQAIAKREGFTLPTELSRDQQSTYDRFSTLTGTNFDDAYMDQLKTDHQEAISLFQDEGQNGNDPQIKSFAQSTLPSLRKHQQMANRPMKRM